MTQSQNTGMSASQSNRENTLKPKRRNRAVIKKENPVVQNMPIETSSVFQQDAGVLENPPPKAPLDDFDIEFDM